MLVITCERATRQHQRVVDTSPSSKLCVKQHPAHGPLRASQCVLRPSRLNMSGPSFLSQVSFGPQVSEVLARQMRVRGKEREKGRRGECHIHHLQEQRRCREVNSPPLHSLRVEACRAQSIVLYYYYYYTILYTDCIGRVSSTSRAFEMLSCLKLD